MDMKDHDGHDPLMVTVMKGNIKFFQYLLPFGQGPEKRTQQNKTPLHLAVEF
jgi:ankyrin repeat protein